MPARLCTLTAAMLLSLMRRSQSKEYVCYQPSGRISTADISQNQSVQQLMKTFDFDFVPALDMPDLKPRAQLDTEGKMPVNLVVISDRAQILESKSINATTRGLKENKFDPKFSPAFLRVDTQS